jgi:hypothetical protein
MSILFNANGSITFQAEDGSGATQTIPPGTSDAVWIPQYKTFQAAHAATSVPEPPPIVVLPDFDPGVFGAVFIASNTLQVSQGPSARPIQIGATGPIGLTGAIIG